MAKRVLGKTMFIGIKNSYDGDEWFDVADSAEELAELGQTIIAAEYRLVRKLKVRTEAKTEIIGK